MSFQRELKVLILDTFYAHTSLLTPWPLNKVLVELVILPEFASLKPKVLCLIRRDSVQSHSKSP